MTNEEVKVVLKSLADNPLLSAEHITKALYKAIELVESQPCEDCISRAEALKAIEKEKQGWEGAERYAIDECHTRIAELPPVTPQQTRWIPVSEKPTEGKYLITGAYGKNRYVDIATFDGEDATDTYAWDSYSDEYKVNRREHKVIAYMPLPKPYEESEDEE